MQMPWSRAVHDEFQTQLFFNRVFFNNCVCVKASKYVHTTPLKESLGNINCPLNSL